MLQTIVQAPPEPYLAARALASVQSVRVSLCLDQMLNRKVALLLRLVKQAQNHFRMSRAISFRTELRVL